MKSRNYDHFHLKRVLEFESSRIISQTNKIPNSKFQSAKLFRLNELLLLSCSIFFWCSIFWGFLSLADFQIPNFVNIKGPALVRKKKGEKGENIRKCLLPRGFRFKAQFTKILFFFSIFQFRRWGNMNDKIDRLRFKFRFFLHFFLGLVIVFLYFSVFPPKLIRVKPTNIFRVSSNSFAVQWGSNRVGCLYSVHLCTSILFQPEFDSFGILTNSHR